MSIILHEVNSVPIGQRPEDGYINLTKLVHASNKLRNENRSIATYLRSASTKEFLEALSSDVQICISELLQVTKGGGRTEQGTWAHPQVAIHCAQWCSPEFAVLVTKWVFEWMSQGKTPRIEPIEPAPPIAPAPEPDLTLEIKTRPINLNPNDVFEAFLGEPDPPEPRNPELALIREAIELGEKLGMDESDKRILKRQLMRVVQVKELFGTIPPPPSTPEQLPQLDNPRIALSDRARELGYCPSMGDLINIGHLAARLYREKHGKNPQKEEKSVNGKPVPVNIYRHQDLTIIDTAIQIVMGAVK